MSGEEEAVIIRLTGKVGELQGGFQALKEFIELQTTSCRSNYENLNSDFTEVKKYIIGKNAVNRETSRIKKIMESRLTLICVVLMAAAAIYTAINSRSTPRAKKNPETICIAPSTDNTTR